MTPETYAQKTMRYVAKRHPKLRVDMASYYNFTLADLTKIVELAIVEERATSIWIGVKDRLPEDGQLVVIYDPENQPTVWPSKYDKKNGVFLSCEGWFEQEEITHWMPLPLPPAAPKDEVSN